MSRIRTYPNKQVAETDPIFTGNIEQSVSTSSSKVPSSALFKTTKETLEASISGKSANGHTHAQSDITNLTTDLSARELLANKSTNVLLGTSDTQYPTQNAVKTYVDNLITGLKWKQSVRVATTTNGTLSTAFANGQVVDGIALVTGDRILIKNQSTASENGIYTVNSSGTPTRATDADSNSEMIAATVFVEQGTVNADTAWVCTNNSITLGSTSLVFAQVFGAGTFTAGTGLQLTGNQFSVDSTVTRQGNSFNGNSQLVQLNSSGQFPALDGRNLTNLPVPTINYTYGENISAGNLVELRTDGKVYKINAVIASAYQTHAFTGTTRTILVDSVNNKIIAVGDNGTNQSIRCGSISGNTITWGTAVEIYANASVIGNFALVYNSTSGAYVLGYSDPTDTNLFKCKAFTVSGNTMTFGTDVYFSGTASATVDLQSTSASMVIVTYRGSGNIITRTLSISVRTLTVNTAVDTGVAGAFDKVFFSDVNNRLFIAVNGGDLRTYTRSSTTLTLEINAQSVFTGTLNSFFYSTALSRVICSVTSPTGATEIVTYYTVEISTTASANDSVLFKKLTAIASSNNVKQVLTASNIIASVFKGNQNTGSVHFKGLTLKDGYNKEFGISTNLNMNVTTTTFNIDGDLCFVVGNYVLGGSSTLRCALISLSNLFNYIGVANATGVNNDSKAVIGKGQIYTTSGLTAGANYYVQLDGSYSTAPTGLYLGKAISTTQLLLDF